ncbi:MAG: hypothetical protein WC505_08275 [Patescibacteria group bacterium]
MSLPEQQETQEQGEVQEPQQDGQKDGNESSDANAQPPTPGAENGAEQQQEEQIDPALCDPDGVPWSKRAKEYQRKYETTLERFASYQKAEPQTVADPNEEIPATRGGVKQVLSELSREEAIAKHAMEDVVEGLSEDNPDIMALKPQIEEQLKSVDVSQRKNPGLIEAVAFAVYGRANFKKQPVKPASVQKKLVSSGKPKSDVLPPSPQGGSMSETKLSEDEERYAIQHRLKEKGFDSEEIHDLFVRAHKKGG